MRSLAVLGVCAAIWLITAWFHVGVGFVEGFDHVSVDYGEMFRATVWMGGTCLLVALVMDVCWGKS